jgi:Arc/MetJ-type ribon-helix-helix transcriptional regulator
MSMLSVPLTPELEKKIVELVENGVAVNKADLARKAIEYFAEQQAIEDVLAAEREMEEGKFLKGDLDELAKKI